MLLSSICDVKNSAILWAKGHNQSEIHRTCVVCMGKTAWTIAISSGDIVDPSGPVVIILATGSEVRRFKPSWGRWIFSECKNPEYDFLRKRNKAMGPVS